MITLIPAYGRDYSTMKQVMDDYEAGKDFIVATITQCRGKYASCRDFYGQCVQLRFNKKRDVVIHRVEDPDLVET